MIYLSKAIRVVARLDDPTIITLGAVAQVNAHTNLIVVHLSSWVLSFQSITEGKKHYEFSIS